jgi:SAM-dependent methyltransferase
MKNWPDWHCPDHSLALKPLADFLVCPQGHSYSIRNAIPRFVADSSYADHFGAQWNKHRLTQLDSSMGGPYSRDRLRRCIGEELWKSLADKQVLECGCGAGRFTEVLLACGAKVTSIDLSQAVDANAATFPVGPAHRVAQADIERLPFQPQQFDLVFCLGVVQHTPNPERTIAALYSHVAPGGSLIIDHYTGVFKWYTRTAPFFRWWLMRMPPGKAMAVTDRMVELLLPLHKAVRSVPVARSIVPRISPLMTYYASAPDLPDNLQRDMALLDTHDTLTDWFKHFRTREQILRTLQGLALGDIWCEYGGNGVEARGKRPAAG